MEDVSLEAMRAAAAQNTALIDVLPPLDWDRATVYDSEDYHSIQIDGRNLESGDTLPIIRTLLKRVAELEARVAELERENKAAWEDANIFKTEATRRLGIIIELEADRAACARGLFYLAGHTEGEARAWVEVISRRLGFGHAIDVPAPVSEGE